MAAYIREDELLKLFFEPFHFEESAATGHSPETVYLQKVNDCDIYLGLLGTEYGFEDAEGISPTEREFNAAQRAHKHCWIFLKGNQSIKRHPKLDAFIEKVGGLVSRKRFGSLEELQKELYRSCILYLKQTGKIDADDFDSATHQKASFPDLSNDAIIEFVRAARYKRNFPLKETDSPEKILAHLNLIREGKLTNSALLAFA